MVSEGHKQHLRSYDKYLKKFEYGAALDVVLKVSPSLVVC